MTVICKESGLSLCSQLHVIQTRISQTFYHWGTSSSYFQIGMQMCVAETLCMLFLTAACDVSYPYESVSSSESAPRRVTECLHLRAKGFWRDLQHSSDETQPLLERGTPLAEVSERMNEGRSERLPVRWAPFAGNEELWLCDSLAGRHGNVWEQDDVGMLWTDHKWSTV